MARFLMLSNSMKQILFFLFLSCSLLVNAQKITLKKGGIINAISVKADSTETFALYLPKSFEPSQSFPVIFVFDEQGRGKQVLSVFREAAEKQGYILAASNNINDTLALSKNVLIASRMFSTVYSMLPIKKERSYAAGFAGGARIASLIPTFVKQIKGVISCGSPIANEEILSVKNEFHFIGIAGNTDYNYTAMLTSKKFLDKLKFPNQLLVFEGGHEWPKSNYIENAMEFFTLAAMTKGLEEKDQLFIDTSYKKHLGEVSNLNSSGRSYEAYKFLDNIMRVYRGVKETDSLKETAKALKRSKLFKTQNRNHNNTLFKENFIKGEYVYYLEEDVFHYNYNNLGWWKHQMEELKKYDKSTNRFERDMGKRLKGYLNALIDDNIDVVKAADPIDEEALTFLWMVKTITDAKNATPYLKVISNSAKVEDYGTALFYLEELLRMGYVNKDELYALEHTALLRITPEFNELVAKYLKEARYDVILDE